MVGSEAVQVAEQSGSDPIHTPMTVVYAGLGKMGIRMAEKLVVAGYPLAGFDVNEEARFRAREAGIPVYDTLEDAIEAGGEPGNRLVWNMLPAKVTGQSLLTVSSRLVEGDIVVDGGNSHYRDTELRALFMADLGLRFLGIGVSGGVKAAKTGYPLMVGGDYSAYEDTTSVLDGLAFPDGAHKYFGKGGVGHLVKMVHNAIEYSIMQGIAEGFGVLEACEHELDLVEIAELYRRGTLVSGFMMDITAELLERDPHLNGQNGVIGSASGEAQWTIELAEQLAVPVESITQAIDFRKRSATDTSISNSFAAKVVAGQREVFGGHTQERLF